MQSPFPYVILLFYVAQRHTGLIIVLLGKSKEFYGLISRQGNQWKLFSVQISALNGTNALYGNGKQETICYLIEGRSQ
jgi:hypothetical protein